jgi:hypothetical protein
VGRAAYQHFGVLPTVVSKVLQTVVPANRGGRCSTHASTGREQEHVQKGDRHSPPRCGRPLPRLTKIRDPSCARKIWRSRKNVRGSTRAHQWWPGGGVGDHKGAYHYYTPTSQDVCHSQVYRRRSPLPFVRRSYRHTVPHRSPRSLAELGSPTIPDLSAVVMPRSITQSSRFPPPTRAPRRRRRRWGRSVFVQPL